MKQTCLCEYLSVTCSHSDTFLHIPLSIRRRIYLYAGLTVSTYTAYPAIGKIERDFYSTTPPENYTVTCNLSNVCLQVRNEIEAIILSENTLVYAGDDVDKGLDFLAELDPYACSMLRNVHVQLHVEQDEYGRYISTPPPLGWKRIKMWEYACNNILAHASPQQLKLHLICDTGLGKKIAAVLGPFRNFPGVLLELELRLHEHNRKYERGPEHQKLLALARDTVIRAQGRDPNATPSEPFRFFDLPSEIRRNIFEYTNLVAPYRKVHWTREGGFHAQFIFCECDGRVCQEENLHANSRFLKCGAYSLITEDYCMKYHSSYSPRCVHGFSPLSVLLVSRAMYVEAIDFFYTSNRIVIQPNLDPENAIFAGANIESTSSKVDAAGSPDATERFGIDELPGALEQLDTEELYDSDQAEFSWTEYIKHDSTKLFMEKVGSRALKLIQNVEIVFPRIGPNSSLSDTDPAYEQWCMAISYLKNLAAHSTVSKLKLIVHIWTTPAGRSNWQLERTAHILQEHAPRLLKPLRALAQLERLFVHLEWPSHWAPPKLLNDIETCTLPKEESSGCGIGYHWIPRPKEDLAEKEVKLEKMVMGDDFDSYSLGKGNELPSQWVRAEWDSMG